jgi:hypothetical protein
MTKKQLLKKLEKVPDGAEIILASDAEGNSYSPLYDVSAPKGLRYIEEDRDIFLMTKDEIEEDFPTQEQYDKGKNCIVFYPV